MAILSKPVTCTHCGVPVAAQWTKCGVCHGPRHSPTSIMQEPTIDDFRDPDRRASFPLALWLGRIIGYQRAFDEQRVRHGRIHALSKDQVWIEDLQPRIGQTKLWVEAYSTDIVTEVRPMEMRVDFEQHQPTGEPMHPNEVLFMHLPFYRMVGRRARLKDKHPDHPGKEGRIIGLYHGRGIIIQPDELLCDVRAPWAEFELLPLEG